MTYVMQRPWMFNVLLLVAGVPLFGLWVYADQYRTLELQLGSGVGSSVMVVAISALLGRLLGRKDTNKARSVYALLAFTVLTLILAGQNGAL